VWSVLCGAFTFLVLAIFHHRYTVTHMKQKRDKMDIRFPTPLTALLGDLGGQSELLISLLMILMSRFVFTSSHLRERRWRNQCGLSTER